jgi:hypothetical protein
MYRHARDDGVIGIKLQTAGVKIKRSPDITICKYLAA